MATRRAFLTHSCKLGAATATLSSLGLSLAIARRTAAADTSDYRALVCILLAGGNDSFNMLVPNDADQFAEYANLRSDSGIGSEHAAADRQHRGRPERRAQLRPASGNLGAAEPLRRRRACPDRQRRDAPRAGGRGGRRKRQRAAAPRPVFSRRSDPAVANRRSRTHASPTAGAGASPTCCTAKGAARRTASP